MGVIISLIVIVAIITLYDYFAAGKWQQVTSVSRNSLVFENRNQEYGAYVLRKDYDKNLMWIMFALFLTIAIAYGSYMIYKSIPEVVVPPPPVDTSQFVVPAPPEEEVPPPPKEELPPPMEKTVAFIAPVVVDIEVDEEVVIVDPDVKVSTVTNDVEEENWSPPVVGEEKVTETKAPEVYTFVDEEAEFAGGFPAMMAFIQKHIVYPETAKEANIQGKCYLKFAVASDGSISGVQVVRGIPGCPECDKAAMKVVREMPKWKAGKINGKSVSSWFQMPINFTLE
jgi:protein TonB